MAEYIDAEGRIEDPTEGLYAVQYAHGGIPDEPVLYDNEADALRAFVESAVAADLEWTEDCSSSWIGNDDDEVRLFGPLTRVVGPLPPPVKNDWNREKSEFEDVPFTDAQKAEVERILGVIREGRREDAEAREVVAEDKTGGCD